MICRACAELTDSLPRLLELQTDEAARTRIIGDVRRAHIEQCATNMPDGGLSPTQCDCQHEVGRKVTGEMSDKV